MNRKKYIYYIFLIRCFAPIVFQEMYSFYQFPFSLPWKNHWIRARLLPGGLSSNNKWQRGNYKPKLNNPLVKKICKQIGNDSWNVSVHTSLREHEHHTISRVLCSTKWRRCSQTAKLYVKYTTKYDLTRHTFRSNAKHTYDRTLITTARCNSFWWLNVSPLPHLLRQSIQRTEGKWNGGEDNK